MANWNCPLAGWETFCQCVLLSHDPRDIHDIKFIWLLPPNAALCEEELSCSSHTRWLLRILKNLFGMLFSCFEVHFNIKCSIFLLRRTNSWIQKGVESRRLLAAVPRPPTALRLVSGPLWQELRHWGAAPHAFAGVVPSLPARVTHEAVAAVAHLLFSPWGTSSIYCASSACRCRYASTQSHLQKSGWFQTQLPPYHWQYFIDNSTSGKKKKKTHKFIDQDTARCRLSSVPNRFLC